MSENKKVKVFFKHNVTSSLGFHSINSEGLILASDLQALLKSDAVRVIKKLKDEKKEAKNTSKK